MSDTEGDALEQLMEFSDPEKRFLENMWIGFKAPPEIDMNKVAARMGMHPRSCGNIWGKLKKKIQHNLSIESPAGASRDSTPAKALSTPKRKRAATGAAGGDGDEDPGSVTPTKKQRTPRAPRGSASKARGGSSARGRGKAAAAKAVKTEAEDDDDDDTPTVSLKKEDVDEDGAETEPAQVPGEV